MWKPTPSVSFRVRSLLLFFPLPFGCVVDILPIEATLASSVSAIAVRSALFEEACIVAFVLLPTRLMLEPEK